MPEIQDNFASLPSYNTLKGSTFLHIILPFKWFNNDIRGMFQWQLGLFDDDVSPFSMASMASSKDFIFQLAFCNYSCAFDCSCRLLALLCSKSRRIVLLGHNLSIQHVELFLLCGTFIIMIDFILLALTSIKLNNHVQEVIFSSFP